MREKRGDICLRNDCNLMDTNYSCCFLYIGSFLGPIARAGKNNNPENGKATVFRKRNHCVVWHRGVWRSSLDQVKNMANCNFYDRLFSLTVISYMLFPFRAGIDLNRHTFSPDQQFTVVASLLKCFCQDCFISRKMKT